MLLHDMIAKAEEKGCTLSELVLQTEAEETGTPKEDLLAEMDRRYQIMVESVEAGSRPNVRSTSGLTGGDAYRLAQKVEQQGALGGAFFASLLSKAMAVSEINASMGRIVAAPTAGSCGIVPATLLTMQEHKGASREECVMALFTAAHIGKVITLNASVSGAEGGCQAECGSAAAMAAGAMVELSGGTPSMIEHAVAIAIKNMLGLVCDPVAGLVEIPCIKRNAGGVATALCAAELALGGVVSNIPADEVIIAMKQIGCSMPAALRETADGGLARTPTGIRLMEQVFGKQ